MNAGTPYADTESKEINPMTTEIRKFLIAYEVKWRSRVGTTNAYDVDPYARVCRGEMSEWCKANGLLLDPLFDSALIQPELRRMWRRLAKEFPNEAWGHTSWAINKSAAA